MPIGSQLSGFEAVPEAGIDLWSQNRKSSVFTEGESSKTLTIL